jgi:putative ABC transport system permease protein
VITSVIGGVLGVAVGVVFAWLTTRSLEEWDLGFTLPPGQLALVLVLAVVVGVLGAVVPARRGARVSVLEAIRYE